MQLVAKQLLESAQSVPEGQGIWLWEQLRPVQLPMTQLSPVGQTMPQPPQFFPSVV
jgi:hypothetical protein